MSVINSYENPWLYETESNNPRIPTLAGFNFTVTDASTGLPIQDARCNIYAGLDGTGDADGGYTDINGIFGIDAQWFVPRSWGVSKEGYTTQISNNMASQIPVALEPIPTADILIETYRGIDIWRDVESLNLYFRYEGLRYEFSSNTPIENVRTRIDELLYEPPPNGPIPEEWIVTRSIHIFDDVPLKAEWYDISKALSRTINNIDTAVLVGGRLDYTVKYTQGMPIAEDANIAINGTNIVHEALSKGESKSGSVDLTGFIGKEITITLSFPSAPGIWSEVMFDVWITFGYSEEPATDPTVTSDFLEKYGKWIALGAIGIVVLLMMQRPSIIVVGGKT